MKSLFFVLNAVRSCVQTLLIPTATQLCTIRVQIKQDGQIRNSALCGKQRKLFDQFDAQSASGPLVGNAGIETAVSDNKHSGGQCGLDDGREMLRTIGLKQKRL